MNHILKFVPLIACIPMIGCSMPNPNDPFRNAQGYAMQGQMQAHQSASLSMAGRQLNALAPSLRVPTFPPFNTYAR